MILTYSQDALSDLDRLRAFITANNPTAAQQVGERLVNQIDKLLFMPKMGRPVEYAPDSESIRDMVFGNYIVRYTVTSQTIYILRIWHHYEDKEC
jgi:addiction module RelE/StbE family toxin